MALKIVSPQLPQKSSVGGVALDVADEASLLRRGRQMLDRVAAKAPGAAIEGLLVQGMERSLFPIELYLGMEADPTFGPVLLLGQATSRAAAAADLTYLLPPLDATLAHAMLDETPIGRFLAQSARWRRAARRRGRRPGPAVRAGGRAAGRAAARDRSPADQPAAPGRARRPCRAGPPRPATRRRGWPSGPIPRELEQTATLRDGSTIRLRPIRPEDAPALKQLFDDLTPEDRRMRMFSSMRELSDELAARLSQIDYDREMVLVALDPEHPERFWGGARIAADADQRRAEYSVTIRSDKQGLGLGRICFERALDYARSRGIEEVWGSVLAENEGMLGLADRLGFTRRRDPDAPEIVITEKRLG